MGGLLGGCASYKPVSYFSPVPRNEVRVENTFRGLDEVAKISFSGEIEFRAILFDRQDGALFRLLIRLPETQVIDFESIDIVALPLDGSSGARASIPTIRMNVITTDGVGRAFYIPGTERLVGATYRPKKATGDAVAIHRQFELEVSFPPLPDRLLIRLPAMRMTHGVVTPPLVMFERKRGSAYQGSPP